MHASNYRLYEPVQVSVRMQTAADSEFMIYSVTRVLMCLKCNEQCWMYTHAAGWQLLWGGMWGEGDLPIIKSQAVQYSSISTELGWLGVWMSVQFMNQCNMKISRSENEQCSCGLGCYKDDTTLVSCSMGNLYFYVMCWINSYRIRWLLMFSVTALTVADSRQWILENQ